MRIGELGRVDDLFMRGIGRTVTDIHLYRVVEKQRFLRDGSDKTAKIADLHISDINPVYRNRPAGRIVKPREKSGRRRLAAAGSPDHRDHFADRYFETRIRKGVRIRRIVFKRDVIEDHLIDELCLRQSVRFFWKAHIRIENAPYSRKRRAPLLALNLKFGQLLDGPVDQKQRRYHRNDFREFRAYRETPYEKQTYKHDADSLDRRAYQKPPPERTQRGFKRVGIGLFVFFLLVAFGVVRLDYSYAGEKLVYPAADD